MEPYNVKIITYPDLTKQFRVYHQDVFYRGYFPKDRIKNPFDDQWTKDIETDIGKHFEHLLVGIVFLRQIKLMFDFIGVDFMFFFQIVAVRLLDWLDSVFLFVSWNL